jgi:hypothetical protein
MYSKKRLILILLVLCFAFVSFTPLTAQELILSKVYMKDGNVFIGEITRYESGIITIKTEYGTFNLDESKVKYITISGSELKESYKEPCIVLKDGKVIPGKISSYISVLKRVKVSSNYGDVTIDRFKDIALIVLEPVEVKPWLSGWAYRKKITIAGSTGAGTNYQVLLKVGESSGAGGYDFHLEGLSAKFPSRKNDGGDLRFTASDGTTLQDFWVESVSGTSPNRVAYVWVEVSADLGTNQDIYCYFGNPSATNASNGANTFIFFDDFSSNTLSNYTETQDSGNEVAYSYDSSNQRVNISNVDTDYHWLTHNTQNVSNNKVKTKIVTGRASGLLFRYQDISNLYLVEMSDPNGDQQGRVYKKVAGNWTSLTSFSISNVAGSVNDLVIGFVGTTLYIWWNNSLVVNGLNLGTDFPSGKFGYSTYRSTGWGDNLIMGKFIYPEPAFSSIGSIEKRD